MEVLVIAIIAAISGGGFGGLAIFVRNKERKREEAKELEHQKQLALEVKKEKYGHDIDIRVRLLEQLPVKTRKLEHTRWELKIDLAGASRAEVTEHGKAVEARDSVVTITLVDQQAAVMEVGTRSYNLSRFFYKPDGVYMTYAEAFIGATRFREAAKAVQTKMINDVEQWARKTQADYEYESYVPEAVHEYL